MSWSQIRWPGLCILMGTSSEMHLPPRFDSLLRQLLFPREHVIDTHRKNRHSFPSQLSSQSPMPQSPCPDSSDLGFIKWACLLGTQYSSSFAHHSDAGTLGTYLMLIPPVSNVVLCVDAAALPALVLMDIWFMCALGLWELLGMFLRWCLLSVCRHFYRDAIGMWRCLLTRLACAWHL